MTSLELCSPLVVRVGIAGAASIAKKNARAIVRSERCALVALASRSRAKAEAWAAELGLEDLKIVDGYDALLADPCVDAVYVPLPTTLHLAFVKKCAAAGKHVLVEKPVAATAADVRAMVAACEAAGVALLDGTMFVHHERFRKIERLFGDGPCWRPTRVTSAFTFSGDDAFLEGGDIRTNGLDPLGCCLGDVGWYCIRFGLAAFGARPTAAAARLRKATAGGTPTDMDCDVLFGDGVLSFHCSFHHHLRQWVEAVSANGRRVSMDDFVIPSREEVCEYVLEDTPDAQTSHYNTVIATLKTPVPVLGCCQEANMWDAFAGLVAQGPKHRDPKFTEAMVLAHEVMDALMASARRGGAQVAV